MIDAFWENPTAFGYAAHKRHRADVIDIFAGRVYDEDAQPSEGTRAFRRLLGRERSYGVEVPISMPIGSRYHPERAGIWNTDDSVEMTEAWMR
jgi:hypothetical protein